MKKLDAFFEYLAENEFNGARWPVPLLWLWAHFSYWKYIISSRCVCAIKGCHVSYSRGWNMPDDCEEWWCKRCEAEGINSMVITRDRFYNDEPLRNLWVAIRGR